jgi:anti-sigma regulatory factor (Ser/Thr protein kinase)
VDLSLELEYAPVAAQRAREELRSRLRDELSADCLFDLSVIVSELVTNSFRYGPGEPIQLRIIVNDDGSVRGEIADQGSGEVAIREMGDGGASGGFGLRIVDALADRWGVYEDTTNVWFELRSP